MSGSGWTARFVALPAVTAVAMAALSAAPRVSTPPRGPATTGIWTSASELARLPMSGPAWTKLKSVADLPAGPPDLADQNDNTDTATMAKALVYARTGEPYYREQVVRLCMAAIGTERDGKCLAFGRNLPGYVIAADLVGLPDDEDRRFRAWLVDALAEPLNGRTLRWIHEDRPNNWGTHAGASRAAVAAYLGDDDELQRVAVVFKGWLGDRTSYAGFRYRDRSWQLDERRPVGINPKGAAKSFAGVARCIDGVLPDDQRRSGPFTWPPPKENYVYEALQGALVQAVILHRAGYDTWSWQDKALLRAFTWLHEQADYPAPGDDTWEPHIINHFYGTSFPAPVPAQAGKNVGWTDWTLGGRP